MTLKSDNSLEFKCAETFDYNNPTISYLQQDLIRKMRKTELRNKAIQ
jgi:hypothetical protein